MTDLPRLLPDETAIRAYDIAVCLERTAVPASDLLSILGKAARLALRLRGVPAISYELIRNVAIVLLDIPADGVRPGPNDRQMLPPLYRFFAPREVAESLSESANGIILR